MLSPPMQMLTMSRNMSQAHSESCLIQYQETRGLWSRRAVARGRAPWVYPALPLHGLGKRDVTRTGFQKVGHAPSAISRVWSRLCSPASSSAPQAPAGTPRAFEYNPGKTGSWGPGGQKSQPLPRDQGAGTWPRARSPLMEE